MGMHYLIQGIFALIGILAVLASIFNWDWFFQSQNSQFIVKNVGRKQARLFYALLGILMIATAIYFFLEVQKTIA
jgi:uncharacterized membrane protein YwzB